jgi:hypothetical protein
MSIRHLFSRALQRFQHLHSHFRYSFLVLPIKHEWSPWITSPVVKKGLFFALNRDWIIYSGESCAKLYLAFILPCYLFKKTKLFTKHDIFFTNFTATPHSLSSFALLFTSIQLPFILLRFLIVHLTVKYIYFFLLPPYSGDRSHIGAEGWLLSFLIFHRR